ncbi:unnamed protein product [Eruca vesicaria subsp. sativa]|uniref:Uncharacterized protein n=1 Tax=Eruca vesicaria subsp. sativa TaxID=29727 RepID=A0ABC8M6Z1_ERUVS|nr:unnamed protein product [Eruca vesicaria subsp. sativa]
MKLRHIKLMFFLLALISTSIVQLLGAQDVHPNTFMCPKKTALDTVSGCFDAVKLASHNDSSLLTSECCQAVKTLPESLLLVSPTRALNTSIFKSICATKFPGSIS